MSQPPARVQQLYPRLTAAERALALLEAKKAGQQPDPRILGTMPGEQTEEFEGHYTRLQQLDEKGRFLAIVLERRIETLETLRGWAATLLVVDGWVGPPADSGRPDLASAAQPVRDALACIEALLDPERRRSEGGAPGRADGPRSPPPIFALVREQLLSGVPDAWRELRGLEIEVQAVAADLGCEDPLMPDLRAMIVDDRSRLEQIAARPLVTAEAVVLLEPGGAFLELVQQVFRSGGP